MQIDYQFVNGINELDDNELELLAELNNYTRKEFKVDKYATELIFRHAVNMVEVGYPNHSLFAERLSLLLRSGAIYAEEIITFGNATP